VFSFEEVNVKENYYPLIRDECLKNNISFFDWKQNKNNLEKIVVSQHITHVILIGWRYLLNEKINSILEEKMIIYHDSLLPKYRGFAPTPSAIIKGEKYIGFSVIFAEKEMDSGDIIYQEKYELKNDYYLKDVVNILSEGYANSIPIVLNNLKVKNYFAQDHNKATYSCWRDIKDMQIDWNKSSKDIFNFIRALSEPLLGAYSYLNGKKVIIKKSQIIEQDIDFEIRYPGKLWKINKNNAIVICGQGLLQITDCYDENNSKIIFKNLRQRFEYISD